MQPKRQRGWEATRPTLRSVVVVRVGLVLAREGGHTGALLAEMRWHWCVDAMTAAG